MQDTVLRAQQGDPKAWSDLYRLSWKAARGWAYSVHPDWVDAEDAASEGLLLASQRLASLHEPSRFLPWLRTIVRRQALRIARQQHCHQPYPEHLTSPSDLVEELEVQQLACLVGQEFKLMPERLREVAALHYLENFTVLQTSSYLSVPVGTVKRRLHEVRRHCQHAFQQPRRSQPELQTLQQAWRTCDLEKMWPALQQALRARTWQPGGALDSLHPLAADLLKPSPSLHDPAHPLGTLALRLRRLLPLAKLEQQPLQSFPLKNPGVALRFTRALVGPFRSLYSAFLASPTPAELGKKMHEARLIDVADLYLCSRAELTLRHLEDWLGQLAANLIPGSRLDCCWERQAAPRYRSALRATSSDPDPLAMGGILEDFPGRPPEATTAHLRLFLQNWLSQPRQDYSQALVELLGKP